MSDGFKTKEEMLAHIERVREKRDAVFNAERAVIEAAEKWWATVFSRGRAVEHSGNELDLQAAVSKLRDVRGK